MSKKEKKQAKSKGKQATKPKPTAKKAVETTALADVPMLDTGDEVLGALGQAAGDEADAPAPKKSRRKKESEPKRDETPDVHESGPELESKTADAGVPAVFGIEPETRIEPLRLPRGAFVAFRKSGGLRFTTGEVVVYPDGRVAYDARGVPQKEYNRLRRALNDGQVIAMRKLLDQSNFWRTSSGGEQNPDGYAYEIAARLGQRSNEIEVFDGSLPEPLKPLVERLSKLLPEAKEITHPES